MIEWGHHPNSNQVSFFLRGNKSPFGSVIDLTHVQLFSHSFLYLFDFIYLRVNYHNSSLLLFQRTLILQGEEYVSRASNDLEQPQDMRATCYHITSEEEGNFQPQVTFVRKRKN